MHYNSGLGYDLFHCSLRSEHSCPDKRSERKALLNILLRPLRLRLNLTKNIRDGREAMNYNNCCNTFLNSFWLLRTLKFLMDSPQNFSSLKKYSLPTIPC